MITRAMAFLLALPLAALATGEDELAKKTQNPVADLVSLPLQLNVDRKLGPTRDGKRTVLNVQPVIPVSIAEDWNLISRTIIPLIDQRDIVPGGAADESGLGDVVQSLFLSPKQPTASGWIWGVGPVFLLPTATDRVLGSEKWGIGPTAVALKQASGWTYGALANHVWSVAGDDERNDISATLVQPFLSYTTRTYTTLGVSSEATYDWKAEQWSVPVNFTVSQLMRLAGQPVSLQLGARYWLESPSNGPEGWGLRVALTLLFPK